LAAFLASINPPHEQNVFSWHAGTMDTMNFKIIGGGIAGLASALAVANAGGQAVVFEKAAKFEPVGAGLQLGPNAARALQKLDAWDAVKPCTYMPPEIHMRDGRSGKILKRLMLGKSFEQKFGHPYLTAHRADLHSALIQVANSYSSIAIKTNAEVPDLSMNGFGDLIAADGVWSKIREKLFPGTAAITTSDTYFRSLLPMPSTTSDVNFECVNLWLFPGGHVVHYPVGDPILLNLIAITNGEEPKSFFKNASHNLQSVLALPTHFTKWQSAYVRPLKQWHQGNITLIGDAAHATLPYLAQGAAMALEDAALLQTELQSNSKTAFKNLSIKRISRTTKLHHSSMRAGQIYHASGLTAFSRNTALTFAPPTLIQNQLDWIYSYKI
jgi:salicylate hydroxylase